MKPAASSFCDIPFLMINAAYVDTINYALRSNMDVQCTDGHDMVLRYVNSYVTKMQDAFIADTLYDSNIDARNAAFRYVVKLHPCEPEMWLVTTRWSVSYLSGRHKKLTVPRFANAMDNPVLQQYQSRSAEASNLSLLEYRYHRKYVTYFTSVQSQRGGNCWMQDGITKKTRILMATYNLAHSLHLLYATASSKLLLHSSFVATVCNCSAQQPTSMGIARRSAHILQQARVQSK